MRDIRVLLHLTRPCAGVTFFNSDDNIEELQIADDASMGVDRGDFTCLVISEDKTAALAEIANVR